MFNVGGMELLVIGLVALVVLGPDKLPGALRQMGSMVGELRRISRGFQVDLKSALDEAERDAERANRSTPASDAGAQAARAELAAMDPPGDRTVEPPTPDYPAPSTTPVDDGTDTSSGQRDA